MKVFCCFHVKTTLPKYKQIVHCFILIIWIILTDHTMQSQTDFRLSLRFFFLFFSLFCFRLIYSERTFHKEIPLHFYKRFFLLAFNSLQVFRAYSQIYLTVNQLDIPDCNLFMLLMFQIKTELTNNVCFIVCLIQHSNVLSTAFH